MRMITGLSGLPAGTAMMASCTVLYCALPSVATVMTVSFASALLVRKATSKLKSRRVGAFVDRRDLFIGSHLIIGKHSTSYRAVAISRIEPSNPEGSACTLSMSCA